MRKGWFTKEYVEVLQQEAELAHTAQRAAERSEEQLRDELRTVRAERDLAETQREDLKTKMLVAGVQVSQAQEDLAHYRAGGAVNATPETAETSCRCVGCEAWDADLWSRRAARFGALTLGVVLGVLWTLIVRACL